MFINNSEFPVPFVVGDEVILVAPGGVVYDPPAEFVTVPDFSAPAPVALSVPATEPVPEPADHDAPASEEEPDHDA